MGTRTICWNADHIVVLLYNYIRGLAKRTLMLLPYGGIIPVKTNAIMPPDFEGISH